MFAPLPLMILISMSAGGPSREGHSGARGEDGAGAGRGGGGREGAAVALTLATTVSCVLPRRVVLLHHASDASDASTLFPTLVRGTRGDAPSRRAPLATKITLAPPTGREWCGGGVEWGLKGTVSAVVAAFRFRAAAEDEGGEAGRTNHNGK